MASHAQVGCWDGTAAIYQLQPPARGGAAGGAPSLELLLHCRADAMPLRGVAWMPAGLAEAEAEAGAGAGAARNVFLTAGHSGCVRIFDARWAARVLTHPAAQTP